MKYRIRTSKQFDRDMKRVEKRGYDIGKIRKTIELLASGDPMPAKYKDHALAGDKLGMRDCHITPDWLLLYIIDGEELILVLQRTGTHSDVFE